MAEAIFYSYWLSYLGHPYRIKAMWEGGCGVKKTCQAYFVEVIAVVSTLLQNVKIQLVSKDMTNSIFWVLTFM